MKIKYFLIFIITGLLSATGLAHESNINDGALTVSAVDIIVNLDGSTTYVSPKIAFPDSLKELSIKGTFLKDAEGFCVSQGKILEDYQAIPPTDDDTPNTVDFNSNGRISQISIANYVISIITCSN